MKRYGLFSALLCAVMLCSSEGWALSCAHLTMKKKYDSNDAVFLGRVKKVEASKNKVGLDQDTVRFQVIRNYKRNDEYLTVLHSYFSIYESPFEEGKAYLVFAEKDKNGNMHIGSCSGSRSVENIEDILEMERFYQNIKEGNNGTQ